MKKRVLSALLVLCMLLTLLPAAAWAAETEEAPLGEEAVAVPAADQAPAAPARDPAPAELAEVTTNLAQWLSEGSRSLKVCGVTVTPDNAHDILVGTDYSIGGGHAKFSVYTQENTVRPTLTLRDLNVDDSAQDTKLDHVIEYIGTGAPDDVLYVEVWNLSSQESTFVSSARNAVDILVKDGSLDLSGFNGHAANTLNLEGTMGPTNLEVRNGDLHIHDITLTADGWGEDGIYISNGRLTVSGADTVVTTTAGSGRGGSTPIYGLESQTQLTLDDIFILEDGLAITSPAGAKAMLMVEDPIPEYGINYYNYGVAFTDENDDLFDGADVVISKPHAHAVDGVDVTFDHTLASDAQTVEDSDTGTETTICYLLLDGEPLAGLGDDGIEIKNDLPAGSYYLADNILFDKGLEVKTGTVNLCLNGKKLEAGDFVMVEGGQTLTLSDCKNGQGARCDGTVVHVSGQIVDFGTDPYTYALGELVVESGKLVNTQADTASSPTGAIDSTGYVTLRGGEVSGPYGVDFTYSDRSYTKPPITLTRAPMLNGSLADIHIVHDAPSVDHLPLIDATGYTGSEAVSITVDVYDGTLSDKLGTPIVKLGDTPASKFSLTNVGYTLAEKTVGGDKCLVLAKEPPHTHAMSAGCETEGEDQVTFTPWSDATKLPTTAGHYYLTTDVTVSHMDAGTFYCDYWIVPDGVVDLCLNGHTITRVSDGTLSGDPTIYFTHTKNSTLNLCDCSEDGTGAILAGDGRSTAIENRHGTLRLYGGTVRGELFGVTATDGSAFEMHGGAVTGTYTYTEASGTFGTGVYVGPSDTFRMTGGTITGNDRGVQVMHGGTFLVEGNVVIADNETANVWLEDYASEPTVVHLTGALGETAKLSLNAGDWSRVEERSSLAAVRGQDYPITEADFAKLSSYDPDYPLQLADGVVSFIVGPRHTHAVSVGCEAEGEGQVTFTRLSAKNGALYIGTKKLEPNLDSRYPLPGGNYYLTEDIELGYPIVVPGNRFGGSVSLCLNGHQLKYTGSGERHTVISTPWELNICDCNGSQGRHTVTDPTTNESVDIAGGLITGGTNGGVIVNRIAGGENTFNLYGGAIAGNQGSWGGGVTLSDNTKMVLYGGQVSYNTWRLDTRYTGFGGICAINATENVSASVEITGEGKVAHNLGGGVRIENHGTVTLSGNAAVADNQGIGNWPSGICLDKNSTLAMSDSASVTGNHIATDFYLSAPTCGGVYAPGGGVTLSGGAKIWDNTVTQNGRATAIDLVLGSEFDTEGGDVLVSVGGPLTADAKIGVSLLTPGQRVFTTGGGGDYADRFTSQQRGRFVEAREGELSLTPYAILQQPTQANQCTVTVNGAPTSYKWYPAKLAEVTGANATAYTTEQGESSSCDGQGVWTGVKNLYGERYFFTIQLSRGDMLVVTPSQDLGYMASVQIVSQDQDHVATGSNTPGQDGAYRLTVPRDGTYDLSLSSQVEDLTLTAAWLELGAEVEGQTAKQFTGEPGSYLCRIRYADGTTLTSDIVTCSGSSVTPGKTDQAAPAGLFTVTDIPAGAATGSIAVTKDADKLEWRPVTTPATGTWTPVVQSGNTATLTGLAAGSYEFRYKETATHNASPATTVQVRALSPDAKALTIAGDIEHGTVTKRRDTVNPGDTVTLAVQPDAGYQLETITVRYTEDGVAKTITPTAKADNPAQYTFTMPDAAVSVTATFVPIPDQGNVKGEVEVKGDTPAVAVDKEVLKDLAGEVPEGQSVTVKLTVEKLDAPADKADIEAVVTGDKANVLYLDLSLVKRVNDNAPTPITDTGDKVLEIVVPYDLTGKTGVSVYRKHGGSAAERLTRADTKADGTYRLEGAGPQGKVYIYTSKFSTYAIGYTAVENLVSTQAPALYLGSATPIPCDGSTVSLPGGGTALFRELSETPNGGKVYGLTLDSANITDVVRIQLGRVGSELVYGAGALFLADQKDTLVVTLKGENTIAVTGTDIDDRIAALAVPGSPVMLVGDGFLTAKATAAAGKEAYGVSGKDLTIYAPLTTEGSTNAVFLSGSASMANALTVEPTGARPVTETLGEGEYIRTSTTLQSDGQPLTRAVFAKRETPLAPLYLDGAAIQPDGQSVSVGGGTATLKREGTDYVLTLSGVSVTKSVKMNGSYAGLLFLGDTTQGLFPTATLTIRLEDDAVIVVSDDETKMGLDLGGFPMSGFDGVCTGIVAAGGQFHVTVEGPGSLRVEAATGEGSLAYGVNVTDLTLNTAVDITAPDGAVYVAGGLTLGGGYAVTRPTSYTLSPSGGYGKALMEGGVPAGRVTVEKKATVSPSRPSSGRPGTVRPSQSVWPFTDVAATDAFYESVKYVYEKGWMLGTSDTAFSPEGELTRAMLAAILYRAAGSPAVKGGPGFEDTLADAWYSDAIVWAAQTQVLRGYGNGKFGPNDPVSEEMMNMVTARQAGQDPAWVGDPALAAPTTRAQAAAMLERYIQVEK